MPIHRLDRRAVLRGTAGVALSLPWLEIMSPARAQAATTARRYVVAYSGISIGGDEDKRPNELVPNTVGPNYDLKTALAPLGPLGAQPYVSVVSGLRIPEDSSPAGWDHFHGGIQSALLTGVHNGLLPPGGDPDTIVMGTSSDQIVADAMAPLGLKYKHLAFKVQAGYYNMYNRSTDSLCFRMEGGNQARKLGMQTSPKAAYDSLFSGLTVGADPSQVKASELAWRKRKSVIDFVRESAQRLRMRLGAVDRRRLDQHLHEIGELGKQVATPPKADAVSASACGRPAPYGPDPSVGANYGGEESRAELMCDLLRLALACDLTRVAALMFTHGQCNMSMQQVPGVGYGSSLHQASHFGAGGDTNHKVAMGIAWHMKHFGTLVKKMAETPDQDGGTLIDGAAMAFLFEGGQGPAGGVRGAKLTAHSGENMAVLVAGRAGGLKAGQHLVAAGLHPANVLVTCMNAVGVPAQKLGNVAGEVPGLR